MKKIKFIAIMVHVHVCNTIKTKKKLMIFSAIAELFVYFEIYGMMEQIRQTRISNSTNSSVVYKLGMTGLNRSCVGFCLTK